MDFQLFHPRTYWHNTGVLPQYACDEHLTCQILPKNNNISGIKKLHA